MLNIADELKTIYRNDMLPIVMKNAPKDLEIHFPSLGLYILTDQILDDSFELNEKLCSKEDLVFGSCEASQIKFTVADVAEDLTGLEFTINQIVNDVHVMPLGKLKVDSCKRQDDLRYKEIIAYDKLKDTDVDVSSWYNGLFPTGNETYTLKQFRSSLLAYLGIEEIDQTLPNDDMIVEKTIDPTQISGRTVLEATVELNGAFGNINRFGKFRRIILQPGYGDYPTDDYPQMDYPVSEFDTSYLNENLIDESISKSMYQSVRFEEYTVKEIDKLQIRAEENDIGAIVGGDQRRVIDTQIGPSIQSTKSDDSVVEITKIEGATTVTPTNPDLDISPDNVATITSAKDFDVVSCGKNFLQLKDGVYEEAGITVNVFNGEASVAGTATWNSLARIPIAPLFLNGVYTLSANNTVATPSLYDLIRLQGGLEVSLNTLNSYKTSTFSKTTIDSIIIRTNKNSAVNYKIKPQLELGSTATPYEPYKSNKLTITKELNKLPNGVADTRERIDDKYVKYTQRIGKVVLDGSEPISLLKDLGTVVRVQIKINNAKNYSVVSSHLQYQQGWDGDFEHIYNYNNEIRLYIDKSRLSSPDIVGANEWLQANPVTVLYELAEPIETIVEEPSQLTSYKGITNITTNANPQVSLTADFYVNPINTYVIEGNFLVFGKSAVELEQIALNAFGNMAKRPYRPYEAQSIGLPYIEVGDALQFATDDVVVGYVLQRTLTGIQALRDEYVAKGNDEREQNFGVNKEIIQLQGKVTRIRKDVEGVAIEVEDLEQDTTSKFTQTANQISAEVTRATGAENALSGSIDVLAGQVVLKVDANGNIGYIDLMGDPDTDLTSILLKADNIDLTGYVSITSLKTPGSVEIDGGNLKAGTVVADSVSTDWVYAGTISGDKINGGTISGVKIVSTGASGTTSIYNGGITSNFIYSDAVSAGNISVGSNVNIYGTSGTVSATNGNFTKINGYTPVTSDNIGNHTAGHATTAGYAEESYHAERADIALVAGSVSGLSTGQITASNTGYGNIDFLGFDNAAGVNWAQANFAPIGSSDIRLKHSVLPMDDLPDELFYELKPYQFKYKTDTYGKGIHFGLIAQQVENAFQRYGLDPYNYDLIDLKDVKAYTDDGMYVTDKTHRIHYTNFIAWLIRIVQKQNERIAYLESII